MKLKAKMLVYIGLSVAIVVGAMTIVIAWRDMKGEEVAAKALMETKALEYAAKIDAFIEAPMHEVTAMNAAMLAMQKAGAPRAELEAMLMNVLKGNANYLDTWVTFVPGAYDGQWGFSPIALMEGDRAYIEAGTAEGFEGEDWWAIPVNAGKEVVMDPYAMKLAARNI